jgi:hypothetical protein
MITVITTSSRFARLVVPGKRPGEELPVLPDMDLPLLRKAVLVVDRLDQALLRARPVRHINAGLLEHAGHGRIPSSRLSFLF